MSDGSQCEAQDQRTQENQGPGDDETTERSAERDGQCGTGCRKQVTWLAMGRGQIAAQTLRGAKALEGLALCRIQGNAVLQESCGRIGQIRRDLLDRSSTLGLR